MTAALQAKQALQHKHLKTAYHPVTRTPQALGNQPGNSAWQVPTGYSRTGYGTGQAFKYTPPTRYAVGFRAGVSPAKQRAAVATATLWPGIVPGFNDVYPTCSAVAVAAHLRFDGGVTMDDDQIWKLHRLAGGDEDASASIEAVLEAARAYPVTGPGWQARLRRFSRTDDSVLVSGIVAGISLPHAGHAVLTQPGGVVSWGRMMPLFGEPDEAWALEWEPVSRVPQFPGQKLGL